MGASAIRLVVAEMKPGEPMRILEEASRGVLLGKDTFRSGRLGGATVEATLKALEGFRRIMDGYGVVRYRAVATSAVREAVNRDTFLDRVRLRTGIDVEVIDGSEENRLSYLAVREVLREHEALTAGDSGLVEIGGGGARPSFLRAEGAEYSGPSAPRSFPQRPNHTRSHGRHAVPPLRLFPAVVRYPGPSSGRNYPWDGMPGKRVPTLPARLFDELRSEHGLGTRDRLLLEVAALLHDVGIYVSLRGHHKHSQYLLSVSEIFGLSREDMAIVSNVARYHRRAGPNKSHLPYMALDSDARVLVNKLAAILRVANALDADHLQKVQDVKIVKEDEAWVLEVEGAGGPTLEGLGGPSPARPPRGAASPG